jgi:hypothetical protein
MLLQRDPIQKYFRLSLQDMDCHSKIKNISSRVRDSNRTEYIGHLCRRTAVLSCYRCRKTLVLKNKQQINIYYNFNHQMSISKSKFWSSNNCLHFSKCIVPLDFESLARIELEVRYRIANELIQGILKGKYHCTVDLLFDWLGLVCFANKKKQLSVAIQLIPNLSNRRSIVH